MSADWGPSGRNSKLGNMSRPGNSMAVNTSQPDPRCPFFCTFSGKFPLITVPVGSSVAPATTVVASPPKNRSPHHSGVSVNLSGKTIRGFDLNAAMAFADRVVSPRRNKQVPWYPARISAVSSESVVSASNATQS
jgi:hypothetical protein